MIDGRLRRVVMFPDDGHPDLAAAVHNLTGDARDEIVLWDQTRVWVDTQDRPFTGSRIYQPVRNPNYNELQLPRERVVARMAGGYWINSDHALSPPTRVAVSAKRGSFHAAAARRNTS